MAEEQSKSRATAPANGTATVTIGSKLPMGLLMQIFEEVDGTEPVLGGGVRATKVHMAKPGGWVINGCSHPQSRSPNYPIVGGFALTEGVPAEFWETWKKQNQHSDMVRKGFIFAMRDVENARAKAKDDAMNRSGLERMDPARLPGGVKVDDDRKDKLQRQLDENMEKADRDRFARQVA